MSTYIKYIKGGCEQHTHDGYYGRRARCRLKGCYEEFETKSSYQPEGSAMSSDALVGIEL